MLGMVTMVKYRCFTIYLYGNCLFDWCDVYHLVYLRLLPFSLWWCSNLRHLSFSLFWGQCLYSTWNAICYGIMQESLSLTLYAEQLFTLTSQNSKIEVLDASCENFAALKERNIPFSFSDSNFIPKLEFEFFFFPDFSSLCWEHPDSR